MINLREDIDKVFMDFELEYDKEENQPKKFIGDLLPKVLEKTMQLGDESILDLWQVVSDSLKGVESGCARRFWPHSSQNLLPDGLDFPHTGHKNSNLLPHSLQNLAPARFSN